MTSPSLKEDLPARFEPLRPASRRRRRLVLLFGTVAWVVALVVLVFVVHRRDAVELALAIVATSFALGLVALSWTRRGRLREEREL